MGKANHAAPPCLGCARVCGQSTTICSSLLVSWMACGAGWTWWIPSRSCSPRQVQNPLRLSCLSSIRTNSCMSSRARGVYCTSPELALVALAVCWMRVQATSSWCLVRPSASPSSASCSCPCEAALILRRQRHHCNSDSARATCRCREILRTLGVGAAISIIMALAVNLTYVPLCHRSVVIPVYTVYSLLVCMWFACASSVLL